ncbi:NUDIX hydrolase [Teichococcus vastitatis]|jgi:8-oxo-dGTP pyrophosphatase MutT (NUDIX family)|uniref:NUDIX hydrolase n=1 Tax=Teichococcus vastitatis TaxID=2307076 RepID=A0ABS9W209_9PROT|nr:NUDIX hydrolase [Pseudoroseomonas vastitatis]MCI0752589.1 NUDIX hydrolase [Pseudoroseomonas vastitatis]
MLHRMNDTPTDRFAPWEVLSSRTALRDRWINVTADACRDARGNVLDPFYTLSYPDWVNVVAITPRDELVLVRQYRHGAQRRTLELPAGAVDPQEADLAVAAARELREETGFVAPSLRITSSLHPNTATHRNRTHTVLALDAERTAETAHEAGEDISVELWPLEKVLRGLPEGLLPQSMHVSGLLLALQAAGRLDLRLSPPR